MCLMSKHIIIHLEWQHKTGFHLKTCRAQNVCIQSYLLDDIYFFLWYDSTNKSKMELCESKNRSCNTTNYVHVYKSSIDVLSFMKLVELNIKPSASTTSRLRSLDARCCSELQDNHQYGKKCSQRISISFPRLT